MSGSTWKFTLLSKKFISDYIWVINGVINVLKDQLKNFCLINDAFSGGESFQGHPNATTAVASCFP